jgi:5'-3' exonuclease
MPKKSTKEKIVKQPAKQPIILIDSSYTSFYRFFATIRWFSFAYPEEWKELKSDNTYDWMTNKIFIEKYEKMFLDSIIKLVKKKVFDNSNVIFCLDTPKKDLWRTELHCNYKGDRADLSLKHNFKPTFTYTYDIMIPRFVKENKNIHSIRVGRMEADDVIACIAMYMKEKDSTNPLYIVSGDEDFLQLGHPYITFINYKHKKPLVLTEMEAMLALQKKLVMGDKSDCIVSIFDKGVRVDKKELIENKEKLEEYLESNPEAKKRYMFNSKMIDFKNIPKKYVDSVSSIFDSIYD